MGSSLKPAYDDSNKRADKATATALRSKRSMAPWKFKKREVSCKIQPQLCYGAIFAKPRVAKLRRLRTAILSSIWGRGRTKRAPELALIICSDPMRSEPEMAIACEAILSFIRYLHRKPQEVVRLWNIAQTYADRGGRRGLKSNFPIWHYLPPCYS